MDAKTEREYFAGASFHLFWFYDDQTPIIYVTDCTDQVVAKGSPLPGEGMAKAVQRVVGLAMSAAGVTNAV
jgi:hypothetical protein